MSRDFFILGIIILLFSGILASSPSPTSPAKIVTGFISNHGASFIKWLWSLLTTTTTTKTVSTKSLVSFENGYTVETLLDGSKLGIEPYYLEVLPNGDFLILDSQDSNIYKVSSPLSQYSRPRLVTGSPEGDSGHVDGRLKDARLNNPKGLTVDDRGNIYVADTLNNAIRKISKGGVTTIAVDGPGEDAKFSDDFDVVYVGSSCSLLVIDRGNQDIREIQLHFDDCVHQSGSGFPLGVSVLVAAGFFGYMLALLQHRIGSILSYHTDHRVYDPVPDQKATRPVRPPLMPSGDEQEIQEESFLVPLQLFVSNAWLFLVELSSGMFPGLRRKQRVSFNFNHQETKRSAFTTTPWLVQERFVTRQKYELPPAKSPKETYPFMPKDAEKTQQPRQSRALYRNLDSEFLQAQQKHQRQQYHRTNPHTLYEKSSEKKVNEIVFGPVQKQNSPVYGSSSCC